MSPALADMYTQKDITPKTDTPLRLKRYGTASPDLRPRCCLERSEAINQQRGEESNSSYMNELDTLLESYNCFAEFGLCAKYYTQGAASAAPYLLYKNFLQGLRNAALFGMQNPLNETLCCGKV
jgi:hypothetical protein